MIVSVTTAASLSKSDSPCEGPNVEHPPKIERSHGTSSYQGSTWVDGCQHCTHASFDARLAHTDEGRRTKELSCMWKELQLTFSVRDATVLHARSGKIFMDSSRESGLVVLIHELLGEAEGDKHPCTCIRVPVSRKLGYDTAAAMGFSK